MDCCLCGEMIEVEEWQLPTNEDTLFGRNAEPLVENGRCCAECDNGVVIPFRMLNAGYTPQQTIEIAKALSTLQDYRERKNA